jgi:hypothetical protein
VLIDEAQDQSVTNRYVAQAYLAPGGNLVAVGDRHQGIYGWRGADADAMDQMEAVMDSLQQYSEISRRTRPALARLPLSVCRRCSKAVIREAQRLVPGIQALPDAPEGSVSSLKDDRALVERLQTTRRGLVMCRMNAPLFGICLKLLSLGVPAGLARGDILKGLETLIDQISCGKREQAILEFMDYLQTWVDDRRAKLAKVPGSDRKIQFLEDKASCLRVLSLDVGVQTVGGLVQRLRSIFPADAALNPETMVLLSTVHGQKGGEATDVYLYSPIFRAKNAQGKDTDKPFSCWDMVWSGKADRLNTLYVAITRARLNLTYVEALPDFEVISGYKGPEERKEDNDGW